MKPNGHFVKSSKSLLYISSIYFFLSINSTFFSQPNLGQCEQFAIFSAVGAIDNVGSTTIYGDVGTNAGAFNGFPPGTIHGAIHIADAISAQAAIDVDILYSYFQSLSCDSTISNVLGNNQLLIANTYCVISATTLEDTLFLDGQNNSDAVFIFKLNGAFTTSSFSTIILKNEAQAKNVYWQVNGLFNLGDNSNFKGTIITDGANSLLSNSIVEGRILSRSGAISLASNVVIMNFQDQPLPIELQSISFECIEKNILIKWETASESNNDYFTLEKSYDTKNWETIADIEGAGNSTSTLQYELLLKPLFSGDNYYFRLKQTDFDGRFSIAKIIYFQNCTSKTLDFVTFPNPSNKELNFRFNQDVEELLKIRLWKSDGTEIKNITYVDYQIDLSNLTPGIYFIQFEFNNLIINKIIIKANHLFEK